MLLRVFVITILLFWPLTAAATDWSQVGEQGAAVNLEADELSYDKDRSEYQASGNVQLTQGPLTVRSRLLWWNQVSGEILAEGDVQLTSPDERMSGSRVRYNLQQGTGLVEEGLLFLREENLYVHGKEIERRGELQYRIVDGTFTTCDGDVPSWKFGADQIDVTLEGYAKAKHAVFYLSDIPSFYVPYIVYPVKNERESGLLTPRVGYSRKRGFQYNGAYYQVLGRNQDATLFFDYLSEMGIGKGLEYRYIFGRENAGEARVYHISVDSVDGEPVNEERYAFSWQHDGELPGGVRMVADILYVDSDDYFEDFGEVAEDYNRDKVDSIFALSKSWGKYSLVGEFDYTKDLETDNPSTLQKLPRISFDVARQRIGESPLYYQVETEYTNFWRDEGLRGERLMLLPSLSASLQLFDVIDVTPELAYRDRYYWGLSDGSSSEQEGLFEFSTRFGTRLQRVYDQPIGAIDKFRHSIEPEITYYFVPELEQGHLPKFDSYDRILDKNRVEYALVQRFTTRSKTDAGDPVYRELVYLKLSQSYYLNENTKDENGNIREELFSSIRGELTLLPTDWLRLDLDVTFNGDQGEWSKANADIEVHDQNENSISVSYRSNQTSDLEYISGTVETSWLKPLYLSYQKRFDLVESEQLEDVLEAEYRQQCWSALLTFRENDTDSSVMLTFIMKGIGPVGGISGSLGGI